MIDGIIEAALASAPPELKSSLKKINEFLPMINMYHSTKPIDKEKGELGIGYLIRFEDKPMVKNVDGTVKESSTGIVLYQVMLASKANVENGKPFVSRQLEKWDVSEKINELTANL